MQSAIATQNIFPGAAVAQRGDTAALAGGTILASHVVTKGGPVKGVVSMLNNGPVFLDDWSLATGGKQLSPGATYFAAPGGKLSTAGTQPIGIATSKNTLAVTMQDSKSQAAASQAATIASLQQQLDALTAQVNSLTSTLRSLNVIRGE